MARPDLTSLRDRSIVVTGSTRGFGRVLVDRLAELGANVVVSGPFEVESQAVVKEITAAGGSAVWSRGDVTRAEDVAEILATAVESFGGVDVWVNNAAYETPGMARVLDFPEATGDVWERTTQVNVLGTGRATLVALEHMLDRGTGVIVNVTGRGDDLKPTPFSAPYGASKAYVRALTRTLRKEYAGSGVNLVSFNPGIMTTARMERAHFIAPEPKAEKNEKALAVITRMFGDEPTVAAERLVEFLASDRSRKHGELRLIDPVRMAKGVKDEAKRQVAARRR